MATVKIILFIAVMLIPFVLLFLSLYTFTENDIFLTIACILMILVLLIFFITFMGICVRILYING